MQNRNIIASISVFFAGFTALAQGTPPPPMPPPPPGLPIDSGIVALFVVALFYGIYKTCKLSIKKRSSFSNR